MPTDELLSPYQAVLGRELPGLHPRLRLYFSALPPGRVGRGAGTWDRVGTPRRWLWPALWILGRAGIAFPIWASDLPFDVVNRPGGGRRHPSVDAVRIFRSPRGDLRMVDSVTARGSELVDRLGTSRRIVAVFDSSVESGALLLTSTAVRVRLGRKTVAIPRGLRPSVSLRESFDDTVGRQRVEVVLAAPLVGRIYEYSGYFDYRVVPAEETDD